MPLFFFIVGFLLIDAGVRGNAKDVASQLATDVQGFLAFGAVILILGGVGLIKSARPVSQAFLVLVFVVFFLKNGTKVIDGIKSSASATAPSSSDSQASNSGSSDSSSGSKDDYSGYINTAANLFAAYEGMG